MSDHRVWRGKVLDTFEQYNNGNITSSKLQTSFRQVASELTAVHDRAVQELLQFIDKLLNANSELVTETARLIGEQRRQDKERKQPGKVKPRIYKPSKPSKPKK